MGPTVWWGCDDEQTDWIEEKRWCFGREKECFGGKLRLKEMLSAAIVADKQATPQFCLCDFIWLDI